jgi:hypothetical protein
VKRLLILAGAALLFTACAESPTSPSGRGIAPGRANHDDDFKCASGYAIAYDEEGNPYCVPVEGAQSGGGNGGGNGAGTAQSSGTGSRP